MAVLLASALGLLVHVSVRRGLLPLDEIGRQVETLDAERLDQRVRMEPGTLELAPVIDRLNALLARLQVSFERERRFSSDIAHELRTPIAELRSLAQVGARWPEDQESVRSYFQDVDAIARQMEGIVANLLSLARCDSGLERLERSEVELRGLVEEAWSRFAPEAEKKGLVFALAEGPPVTVASDRGKLGLILSNLFSNAVAYSPAAARFRARWMSRGLRWRIRLPCWSLGICRICSNGSGGRMRPGRGRFTRGWGCLWRGLSQSCWGGSWGRSWWVGGWWCGWGPPPGKGIGANLTSIGRAVESFQ